MYHSSIRIVLTEGHHDLHLNKQQDHEVHVKHVCQCHVILPTKWDLSNCHFSSIVHTLCAHVHVSFLT